MPLDRNDTKLLQDVTASIVVPAHPIGPPAEILSRHSGVKERTTFFYGKIPILAFEPILTHY